MKFPGALYNKETRVLSRFAARNRSKLVELPKIEVQSSFDEIQVTKSEVEILREAEIISPRVNAKRRRKLVLSDSSSSSSDHSTPAPQKEVSSSRRPVTKKGNEAPIYYVRTPHTRPKIKLRYNFKLMENPWLKDHIINVDESPQEKKGKKPARKDRVKLVKHMREKKMDGLELLLAALDSLN